MQDLILYIRHCFITMPFFICGLPAYYKTYYIAPNLSHMKKIYLLLFVLCTGISAFAQKTIQSKIKDLTTGEPVEMATVSADGTTISTVSNAEGSFRIIVPNDATTLSISHLNYKPFSVSVAEASGEINLEPSIITLEEIVVSNVPVDGLLRGAVKASKKKLEKSLLLNTYYREFVKINGKYTRFSDGLVDFYVKRKSGAADVYVNQSRAIKLVKKGDKGILTHGNDSISEADERSLETVNLYKLDDAVSDAYNFKIIEKILGNAKDYNFVLKTRQDKSGRDLQIVAISPKPGSEGLYSGSVTYDTKTMLILESSYAIDPLYKKNTVDIRFLGFHIVLTANEKKTIFTNDNDKYIMKYNKGRLSMHMEYKQKLNDEMEFLSDVVVNNYKETEETPDKSKRFKGKSLYSAGSHYTAEFWKNSNALLLTTAEENILKAVQ